MGNNRILIVDDEPHVLDMIGQGLTSEGFKCEVAISGEDALEMIMQNDYEFLIVDVVLPGMDGIDLTRKAKKQKKDILVILMTGFVEKFSYETAHSTGASDFIGKPFRVQELILRMKHVRMQERLRLMSITDELTGLLNRRGFFPMAEKQLKIADRFGDEMALLFVDQDNLKSINDTWGHKEGDSAIVNTACLIKDTFRDSDIIARMGGDEFAILMVVDREFNGDVVVKRLEETFGQHNRNSSEKYDLSISVGCALYKPESMFSLDDLISRADAEMYHNKSLKRSV